MSHDLAERPAWSDPPGYRLTDVDRPAADLIEAYRRRLSARPRRSSRRAARARARDLERDLSGAEFGPLLRGSGLAVDADGTVAGAILLGTLPGEPPLNGPWVIELFRHPAAPRRRPRAAASARWRSPTGRPSA